ncbi:hypothetical protein ACFLSJ_01965 [Verrucomicrobiota bacterium]
MAEELIFSDEEAEFLKELRRQKVDFMIVGLAAAALQGAPVVTQDVDLWFRDLTDPGIRRALKAVGGTYVPPIELNPPMFAGRAVGLFDIVTHMHGLREFDQEKRNTIKVRLGRFRLPVLKLERIIAGKKATGRPKDKLAVPVLRDALKAIRALHHGSPTARSSEQAG